LADEVGLYHHLSLVLARNQEGLALSTTGETVPCLFGTALQQFPR
jgi:hypothetical protein